MNEAEFYLEDLKSKFQKIDPDKYYLAYSGGRDSYFLLWFLKDYLKEFRIPAIYNNTGIDLPEIRHRAYARADIILKPVISHWEIKEKHGIPLNTKQSDYYVWEYQKRQAAGMPEADMPKWLKWSACRDTSCAPENKQGLLPQTVVELKTSEAMRSGKLHKVSHLCCKYMKKKPAREFEKETGRKPILGIMGSESITRKNKITTCFNQKGYFYPIHDLTESLRDKIEQEYSIPVPKVYKFLTQTGCAGCPYGQHGKDRFTNTNIDLSLCGNSQRKFILEYFGESYKFKGYEYRPTLFSTTEFI